MLLCEPGYQTTVFLVTCCYVNQDIKLLYQATVFLVTCYQATVFLVLLCEPGYQATVFLVTCYVM